MKNVDISFDGSGFDPYGVASPEDAAAHWLTCVLDIGRNMRQAQKRYYAAERGTAEKVEALRESKTLERAFDALLAKIAQDEKSGQKNLF